jgi:hypothetical protein
MEIAYTVLQQIVQWNWLNFGNRLAIAVRRGKAPSIVNRYHRPLSATDFPLNQ